MWLTALKSCWFQRYRIMRSYLFNTLSGFLTFYIVFSLMFFGIKGITDVLDLGNTLEGVFAGYIVWVLAMMGSTDLAWSISNEVQLGTFEQLYLSPAGYKWIAIFTLSFNFVANSIFVGTLLLVMSVTSGQVINLDVPSVLPIMFMIYLQATGIGLVLARLALIYKRVQAFFQIVQFVMVGLFFLPFDTMPCAKYLPLTMGRHVLQKILIDGKRMWHINSVNLIIVLLVTAGYLILGFYAFSIAESKAKERGLLGQAPA